MLRSLKIGKKTILGDVDLIHIESPQHLGRVIADVARFDDRALDLVLDDERKLLVIRRLEIRVHQSEFRVRIQGILLRECGGHLERGRRNRRKAAYGSAEVVVRRIGL